MNRKAKLWMNAETDFRKGHFSDTILETIEILSDRETMLMIQQSLEDIRAGRLHDHADVENKLG